MTATQSHETVQKYPFQLRGSLQTVLVLRIKDPDTPEFFPLLVDKIAHSPDFFRDAPVVIDVAAIVKSQPLDMPRFAEELRRHRLFPIGIQNGDGDWNEEAKRANLAVFGAGGPAKDESALGSPRSVAPASPSRRGSARLITQPVRGGQEIISQDGDLVVTAMVGHGAEIAATGHIHVYGTLRGRAFAGIDGDEQAMIFCDRLNAQLISIAGIHLVNDEIDAELIDQRVQIRCDGERLHLTPLP